MKILRPVWGEVRFLWRTLAVIFAVLTAFGAALLSVLSVMLDTPSGMYSGIDANKQNYCSLYGGECYALYADSCTLSAVQSYGADLCYGTAEGLTHEATLECDGASLATDVVTQLGNGSKLEYRVERHGYYVPVGYASHLQFGGTASGGVWLSEEVAEELSAQAGDAVTIGARTFTVLGVFDREHVMTDYGGHPVVPTAWFYLVGEDNLTFDRLYLTWTSSRRVLDTWRAACGKLAMSDILLKWVDDIALVQTYYGCVAILLGALTLFVLYVLFAVFYRERKPQMCRLSLLGATPYAVAGIYFVIAACVTLCSTVLAAALSVPLSKHMLNVCTRMFLVTYPYHFRVWLPLAFAGGCLAVCCAMFFAVQRRLSRLPIAREVRYE